MLGFLCTNVVIACYSRPTKIRLSGLPLHVRFDNIEPLLSQYGNVMCCEKVLSRDANSQAVHISYDTPEQAQQWVLHQQTTWPYVSLVVAASLFVLSIITLVCARMQRARYRFGRATQATLSRAPTLAQSPVSVWTSTMYSLFGGGSDR